MRLCSVVGRLRNRAEDRTDPAALPVRRGGATRLAASVVNQRSISAEDEEKSVAEALTVQVVEGAAP